MASTAPTFRNRLPADPDGSAEELLRRADALGIPWRRLLLQELEAEERLRTFVPGLSTDFPWDEALEILSARAAQSWRVRDALETVAWQSRASMKGATKRLRDFVRALGTSASDDGRGSRGCEAAYRRILILQRARRAALRSREMPMPERLAFICTTARCRFEDAEWAVREESAPRRGRRMESAVRKARDEGHFVPRAATEARSLSSLRRIVFGFRDASSRNRRSRAS
jgi:hypothetical protein